MSDANAAANEPKEKNQVQEIIAAGMTCLALKTGAKLGLLAALMQIKGQWFTAAQLAHKMDMRERYIREWLCTMAAGGLLETQPDGKHFQLTAQMAEQFVTAGVEFSTSSNIGLVVGVILYEDIWQASTKVESCFKHNGPTGTSYEDYGNFHRIMGAISNRNHANKILKEYIPLFNGFEDKLECGIKVLDIGCGLGLPSKILAEKFPKSEFHGIDFAEEAIASAKAESNSLQNLHFAVMNAEKLAVEWTESFDVVTLFDAFHDQAYPDRCLKEVHRILKSGGRVIIYDVRGTSNVHEDIKTVSTAPTMYGFSLYHCMPVSLYFPNGMGLGAMVGRQVEMQMMTDAGFNDVKIIHLPNDTYQDFYTGFKS